jgi:hypothetical protein
LLEYSNQGTSLLVLFKRGNDEYIRMFYAVTCWDFKLMGRFTEHGKIMLGVNYAVAERVYLDEVRAFGIMNVELTL